MNMDAVKFISEHKRMCESFGTSCNGCPLHGHPCTFISSITNGDCKRILVKVEQWSKEHPIKTRQNVFLEQWPEAKVADDGILMLCPVVVSSTYRNQYGGCKTPCASCDDCCRKFWMQEVD